MIDRRTFLVGAAALSAVLSRPGTASTAAEPWTQKLLAAAERQVGETLLYDPAYVRLDYPGGDVPRDRGVCTDVIVRAYRDGLGIDLQKLVHEDMKRNFAAYPRNWGLAGPDRNIDHRRVPNLQAFFRRQGAELPVTDGPGGYQPGDVVSQRLPGNLAHIALLSSRMGGDGATPMMIHNIGAGARLEDRLFEFEITGHYRFAGVWRSAISRAMRGKSAGLMPMSARSALLIALSTARAAL